MRRGGRKFSIRWRMLPESLRKRQDAVREGVGDGDNHSSSHYRGEEEKRKGSEFSKTKAHSSRKETGTELHEFV